MRFAELAEEDLVSIVDIQQEITDELAMLILDGKVDDGAKGAGLSRRRKFSFTVN